MWDADCTSAAAEAGGGPAGGAAGAPPCYRTARRRGGFSEAWKVRPALRGTVIVWPESVMVNVPVPLVGSAA